MGLEFRPRNYRAEEEAHSLSRVPAESHPLSAPSPSPSHHQFTVVHNEDSGFIDPLRRLENQSLVSLEDSQDEAFHSPAGPLSEASVQFPAKEWISFRKILMQRFPVCKMISLSSISSAVMKSGKANEKSSINLHLEELDDPQKFTEEGVKVISQQDYMSRLHELKEEIARAWNSDDRVTSLKLSIKVARLLMDTSVEQFYPKLFLLATDVLDMLGDLVWNRIRQRAEYAENGKFISPLPDNFEASDICFEAKETCHNWFSKIGCIHELLPRIYLELAILPCWRFLVDHPLDSLQRMVLMTRGIGDPLAAAYCRLYIVHRAQKLLQCGTGYLITCINDMQILLTNITSIKEVRYMKFSGNSRVLLGLIEPAIEYIMKNIFKDSDQTQVPEILLGLRLGKKKTELFSQCACTSIVLHHLLKELPIEFVCANALGIFHLIESNNDNSFDQCLNYQLLGFRLCEKVSQVNQFEMVATKVIQVVTCYSTLDEYLKITDAYLEIIMKRDGYLEVILDGIFERTCDREIDEDELASLQSILLKLLTYFEKLENILGLKHFINILDAMRQSSRIIVNMHILRMATRNSSIQDPTVIQFLSEVAQALHDGIDISNIRSDENRQVAHLVSRFVNMVDFGPRVEEHLTFLVDCRGALNGFGELKETLVHLSNLLAIKAIKNRNSHINFVRSCLALSEVTIPSVPVPIRQLNLYLETAEVALLGGLITHVDGLIDSAISCLQNIDEAEDSQRSTDFGMITSLIRKLCSLIILVPGNVELGVTYVPRRILSFLNSESQVFPRMKIQVLCALISMSAASCQSSSPYKTFQGEVGASNQMFFREPAYLQNVWSLSNVILQNLQSAILQEPSQAIRGHLALEACNCIVSSFSVNTETSAICSRLVEIAKSCLSPNDRYLMSTLKYLGNYLLPTSHEEIDS